MISLPATELTMDSITRDGKLAIIYVLKMFLLMAIAIPLTPHHTMAAEKSVSSPDGKLVAHLSLIEGVPHYQVTRAGASVVGKSRLGLTLKEFDSFDSGWELASTEEASVDETWTQPWGEKKDIRCHYNELRVHLKKHSDTPHQMTIVLRVFDDGLGFRYELPEQEHLGKFHIMNEHTQFNLTGDHRTWWIPAFIDNRYESLYSQSAVSELDKVHTPVTFETAAGLCISIHEAALTDYSSMALARTGGTTLEANLIPWSDGVKVRGENSLISPWRTIQVAERATDLITSHLILNLNEPNKLEDLSWIEPSKYVGVWWEMHLGTATWGSGDKHGATTENTKRYIDFAAEHGFSGVLVEGWNIGWDGNWMENGKLFKFDAPYPDFDIQELSKYGEEKGVRLVGHHETSGDVENYESQLEQAFAFARQHRINTIKTGYVGFRDGIMRTDEQGNKQGEWHHGQYMVRHYRKVVEEAARQGIMLVVHEPIKDTGIRRTYPNMMTREGARGQEYSAWAGDGGNPPDHTTILPFTRMLAGPMDFTPGTFDLLFEEERPDNRINTTLAKQLALYVVLYSPVHMASDLPENYQANLEPFQFIVDVPTDWEDTQVVDGTIGDYVTIARKDRNSSDWFLGSVTDEHGRTLETPLSFLDADKKYIATIYRDGPEADWETRPHDVEIVHSLVDRSMTLSLRLAPGGGQAIRFREATADEVQRHSVARNH